MAERENVAAHHFGRMWADRHDERVVVMGEGAAFFRTPVIFDKAARRENIRANIRCQRAGRTA